jgi:hypothetical protein
MLLTRKRDWRTLFILIIYHKHCYSIILTKQPAKAGGLSYGLKVRMPLYKTIGNIGGNWPSFNISLLYCYSSPWYTITRNAMYLSTLLRYQEA